MHKKSKDSGVGLLWLPLIGFLLYAESTDNPHSVDANLGKRCNYEILPNFCI